MGHLVQPPRRSRSPTAGCTGPCPGGSWISPEKETPQPPWAACSSAPSPSERSSSSCSDGTSCASVCAHYPLSCHWAPLKRAWPHPPEINWYSGKLSALLLRDNTFLIDQKQLVHFLWTWKLKPRNTNVISFLKHQPYTLQREIISSISPTAVIFTSALPFEESLTWGSRPQNFKGNESPSSLCFRSPSYMDKCPFVMALKLTQANICICVLYFFSYSEFLAIK